MAETVKTHIETDASVNIVDSRAFSHNSRVQGQMAVKVNFKKNYFNSRFRNYSLSFNYTLIKTNKIDCFFISHGRVLRVQYQFTGIYTFLLSKYIQLTKVQNMQES